MFSDGCHSNVTEIPSYQSGNANLTISISWPESSIGEPAKVQCLCGNITLGGSILFATRRCGGDFKNGGRWTNPDVASCNFSDVSHEICQLAKVCVYTSIF